MSYPGKIPSPRLSRSQAFTLIELLTVIAIIAVLAGLTMAGLGTMRQRAQSTQCLSNLRQLYAAAGLYSAEHKQFTAPPTFYTALRDGGYLQPLNKNDMLNCSGVWMCSADTTDRTAIPDNQVDSISRISYGYNAQKIGLPPTYWTTSAITLPAIPRPSHTLYFSDASLYFMNVVAANRNAVFRHNGKINVVFFDGHTATLPEPANPTLLTQFYNDLF